MSGLGEPRPKAPVWTKALAVLAIIIVALAIGHQVIMKTFGMRMPGHGL